jgi:hypothetical protein
MSGKTTIMLDYGDKLALILVYCVRSEVWKNHVSNKQNRTKFIDIQL